MTEKEAIAEMKKWLKEKDHGYRSAEIWKRELVKKIGKVIKELAT